MYTACNCFLKVSGILHCLFSWKVTSNKMQGHFWHLFLIELFMFFHMLALVLLSMVSTIFLLVKILQQPIKILISGFCSCHREQNACYHVKEHKKLCQKLVSKVTLHFVCCHLSKKQTVTWNNQNTRQSILK